MNRVTIRMLISGFLMVNIVSASGGKADALAPYGVPVQFKSAPIQFEDFKLTYLGKRDLPGPGKLVFSYYDFKIDSGTLEQIVSWSSGTGVIAPRPFYIGKDHFLLELHSAGRLNKKLADDEVQITKLRRIPAQLGAGIDLKVLLRDDLVEFPKFTVHFDGFWRSDVYERDVYHLRVESDSAQTSVQVPAENMAVFDICGHRYVAETLDRKLTIRLQQ